MIIFLLILIVAILLFGATRVKDAAVAGIFGIMTGVVLLLLIGSCQP